ncbi:tetraacyldisaccharide 4'-kinase [Asaia sp. W19]|uniref:tetraacyldisaccharide 4'-kinase n=1 Tax=unclassified Asaia TaxID=2685023 RepID=UPI000F8F14D3|nr:tetraacyldisaccharide 4'-kinase [Asaia sp. W19]RUT26571.1 tetraacyldisaccharide 4'-kinase [Asaia sp. W19]
MRLKPGPPGFWRDQSPRWQARALTPLAWAVDTLGTFRALRATPALSPVPVLCCGNLTVGGTGKTIIVRDLAQRLVARGEQPHILSRGYGGQLKGPLRVDPVHHTARDTGDEPFMLAQDFPVWIGANRAETARLAAEAGATCLLMDDGLQNHSLRQTMKLIAIDGSVGLGNGRILPAGPMREPASRGFARADAVILIGRDDTGLVPSLPPGLPALTARLIPSSVIRKLQGRQVIAFAGIGRPTKFFEMLTDSGAPPMRCIPFDDHHDYNERDCRRLSVLSRQPGAVLVTTRKDWVKLPEWLRSEVTVIDVELLWADPGAPERLLDLLLANV